MTKEIVIATRDKFKEAGLDIVSIMLDENVNFSSRDSFLLWDDANGLLTIITTYQDTMMSANKSRRGEIVVTGYDSIVTISAVPDLDKIDTWLPAVAKGVTDVDGDKIKNSFKQITDSKYFL